MADKILTDTELLFTYYEKYKQTSWELVKEHFMHHIKLCINDLIANNCFFQIDLTNLKDDEIICYVEKFFKQIKYPIDIN